jgi:hypothetical protein
MRYWLIIMIVAMTSVFLLDATVMMFMLINVSCFVVTLVLQDHKVSREMMAVKEYVNTVN